MSSDSTATKQLSAPASPGAASPAASPPADVPRFLSQEACVALLQQLHAFGVPPSQRINLDSWWRSDVRWARNRTTLASDWRTTRVGLHAGFDDLAMNQIDTVSLRRAAERLGFPAGAPPVSVLASMGTGLGPEDLPQTHIWSETSYTQSPEALAKVVAQATAMAEQAGVLSAGYLSVEARGVALWGDMEVPQFARQMSVQCSITMRDPQAQGAGWAGGSSFDWARLDMAQLAARALDKCLKSRNPVKVEPGRYTAILEPQAVYELVRQLFNNSSYSHGNMDMQLNEENNQPDNATDPPIRQIFMEWPPQTLRYSTGPFDQPTKYLKTLIGQRVIDPRLTLRSDPLDPQLGTLPFSNIYGDFGSPFVPVTWIEHGVLKTLAMTRDWALKSRHQRPQPWPFTPVHPEQGPPPAGAYRLESSDTPVSVEEMIANTRRGLLVTRLWNGMTRDGLWLIEQGKISHPVMNFRCTESPMVMLNQVEQIGAPVPIFNPECPAVIPPIKVRDCNFPALVVAV